VYALRLLLAFVLLALANLAGSGEALACDRGTTANAPAGSAQEMAIASRTQPRFVVWAAAAEPLDQTGHAGHHRGLPHQHDHGGPNGCCMPCCGLAVPHVLTAESKILVERPVRGALLVCHTTAVAKAGACLPFRPPRTI